MSNTVGEKIRKFRKRSGISQFELELRIDASPGSISRIESGQVNPTKETLRKIIEVLDLKALEAGMLFDIDFDELPKVVELARKLSSKLDLDLLLQNTVNEIVFDLNIFGSILFLCDKNNVYAKTLTQTGYTKLIIEVLPVPLSSLKTSLLDNKENYIVRTINERKPFYSSRLSDFSKNVIPDSMSDFIQKMNGTRYIVSLPMIAEGVTVGALLFSKNNADDFDAEFEILEAFSSHVAVIIKNAMRYQELQDKIKQLEMRIE